MKKLNQRDLIIGNWYRNLEHEDNFSFKFKSLSSSNSVLCSQYIKDGIFYPRSGMGGLKGDEYEFLGLGYYEDFLSENYSSIVTNTDTPEVRTKNEFPSYGCYYDPDDLVLNYLKSLNFSEENGSFRKETFRQYIQWDNFQYRYFQSPSFDYKNYTSEQIKYLLNLNTIKNEVQGFTSKDTNAVIRGAIGVRSDRQQVAIGSRPKGNRACIIKCKSRVVSTKIRGNVIKHTNS